MRGPLAGRAVVVGPAIVSFPVVGAVLVEGDRLALASRNVRPARVALLPLDGSAPARSAEVPTGDGAWGIAADGRGGLWVGMFGARGRANLYRIDLGSLAVAPAAAIDAVHLWDLAVGDDGVVYGVSDGQASVFAYDPRTGLARDLGIVRRGPEGARSVAVLGRTLVVGGRGEGGALLRAHDLDGGSTRSILPAALAGHQMVYTLATDGGRLAVGTRGPGERDPAVALLDARDLGAPPLQVAVAPGASVVDGLLVERSRTWATLRPSGALAAVPTGGGPLVEVARPVPDTEQRGVVRHGGHLVGAAGDGRVWRVDPGTGTATVVDPLAEGLVEGGPEIVQSLVAADGRVWAGGTFGVARRDPDGALTRTPVPGEPKAMAVIGGDLYLALYPIGEVWVLPAGGRPARLTSLPRDENRPLALQHDAQNGALLVGTASDRSGGGGLHVIDPATGALRSHRNPIDAASPVLRLTAGGGLALLGGRDGTLVAWDVATGGEVWRIPAPAPGAGGVTGLTLVGGVAHALTAGGWHLVVDLAARTVVSRKRIGESGGGVVAVDVDVYGVDGDRLLALRADGPPAVLLEGLAPRSWGSPTLAADGGDLLVLRGTDVVRVRP